VTGWILRLRRFSPDACWPGGGVISSAGALSWSCSGRRLRVSGRNLPCRPGSSTQEAAAERLGLPFRTYRRHLTKGIEELIEVMWSQELYGAEQQLNTDWSVG
jgi:hypothetical protein